MWVEDGGPCEWTCEQPVHLAPPMQHIPTNDLFLRIERGSPYKFIVWTHEHIKIISGKTDPRTYQIC